MSETLGKKLKALGYLGEASGTDLSEAQESASRQMACAARRQGLIGRARPHWGAFLDTWASPMLREAASNAPVAERSRIALAFAESLPEELSAALEELSGRCLADLLLPWVELALLRRHNISLPAGALLEEWGAALDPDDPMDEGDFWRHLRQQVRRQESQMDRQEALSQVAPVSSALVRQTHARIAQEKKGWAALKVWRRRPAQWLGDLIANPTFVRETATIIVQHTQYWTNRLKGEQAFPALAVELEKELTRRLRATSPSEVDALERWLALAIEQALPQVLVDRMATPQVTRMVRESLHQNAHANSLVPAPLLRPTPLRGEQKR